MIIKSREKLEVGKRYAEGFTIVVWDDQINDTVAYPDHPTFILREATREEFLQECMDTNTPIGTILSDDKFFDVSVD